MARRVFYSFHYEADSWRTSQVRNIGTIEGNRPVSDNAWEQVKRGGYKAIQIVRFAVIEISVPHFLKGSDFAKLAALKILT